MTEIALPIASILLAPRQRPDIGGIMAPKEGCGYSAGDRPEHRCVAFLYLNQKGFGNRRLQGFVRAFSQTNGFSRSWAGFFAYSP